MKRPRRDPRSRWARLGLAGVSFFLIKGLVWLIVAGLLTGETRLQLNARRLRGVHGDGNVIIDEPRTAAAEVRVDEVVPWCQLERRNTLRVGHGREIRRNNTNLDTGDGRPGGVHHGDREEPTWWVHGILVATGEENQPKGPHRHPSMPLRVHGVAMTF